MIGNTEERQAIKELYGAADWSLGRTRPAGVRALSVLSAEAAPLPLIKRTPLSGGAYIDAYGDGDEVFVTVWVYNCGSPEKAHEAMVDHLLTCTAPRLPEAGEKGLQTGDVSFAGVDDPTTSLVFVRDHFLARIHSDGKTPYPIEKMARAVDGLLAVED